jgi:predicted translin family RNA/ssDNA-binding protein
MVDGQACADARFYAYLARKEIATLERRVEVLERLLRDVMHIAIADVLAANLHKKENGDDHP